MKTTLLTACHNAAEAHLIKGKLLNAGIDCFLTNENMTTLAPHHNQYLNAGVRIMVKEEDLNKARELIKEKLEPVSEIHACPNCGSKDLLLGFGKRKPLKIFYIFVVIMAAMPLGKLRPKYFCITCGFEIKHK
jgi:predicted RNA-binding Zn-ribbon protein involved in translation (DUF1610 family)